MITIKYVWFTPIILPFFILGMWFAINFVAGVDYYEYGRAVMANVSLLAGMIIGLIWIYETDKSPSFTINLNKRSD